MACNDAFLDGVTNIYTFYSLHSSLTVLSSHDSANMHPLLDIGPRQRLNIVNGVHRQGFIQKMGGNIQPGNP